VVNSLEVVQAQEAVSAAEENYTSSLYRYNVAKASLARALGLAEEAFKQMTGGSR
jgi:outer membrane protein TolC